MTSWLSALSCASCLGVSRVRSSCSGWGELSVGIAIGGMSTPPLAKQPGSASQSTLTTSSMRPPLSSMPREEPNGKIFFEKTTSRETKKLLYPNHITANLFAHMDAQQRPTVYFYLQTCPPISYGHSTSNPKYVNDHKWALYHVRHYMVFSHAKPTMEFDLSNSQQSRHIPPKFKRKMTLKT